jgi:hypothetical protein
MDMLSRDGAKLFAERPQAFENFTYQRGSLVNPFGYVYL